MCQKTCQSTTALCESSACIDGCFCPEGMVLQNDVCIREENCPCMDKGKEYKSGDVIPRECNKW